ncbi:MAG TPA: hypothetical protein VMQ76_13135, partial [Terracidiphilus sp.]|nr:hypothetical protein [Terracidiphilus sp.]
IMDTKTQLFSSRAAEKASAALYILATGDGDLKKRLLRAWRELGTLSDRSLPADFQEPYDQMHESVTSHDGESYDEGSIAASIRHMSAEEADHLARQMVAFAVDVAIATAEGR